jgi:signal transduction histidine kinase
MSNVIPFRHATPHHHVGAAFLADPTPHAHAVQFYEEEAFLFETVGRFLAAGLGAGDRMVVIATPAHREGFLRHLAGPALEGAIADGQLVLLDARDTLAKFMVGDMPDPDLFRDMLGRVLATLRGDEHRDTRIRAYGEMVDLLWKSGNSKAAIRLEELWNDAGKEHSFSLLCAYVMGSFYKEGDAARFMEVCRNHSHVLPTEAFSELEDPHARLREISLLQQRARSLENEVQHRKELEGALRKALKARSQVEEELRACVKREKEARARAEASDAFKEVFLGILGHDLRNPLNTVLTTARLMLMRGDVSGENGKRIDRVVASGVRMQRMIEQLLDVTRARHGDGLGITLSERETNLASLVSKIVDETRSANPGRTIEFETSGPCAVRLDGDRFEQVVSNLLGNAVSHGAPERPIRVVVDARDDVASVSVHNYGKSIDPAFLPRLFDPFKQGARSEGRSEGLGLGLYISERIVSAHGGKIDVTSGRETGTCFEVIVPRNRG